MISYLLLPTPSSAVISSTHNHTRHEVVTRDSSG